MEDEIQEGLPPAEPPAPEPAPRPSREQLIGALAEEYGMGPEDIAGAIQLRDQYSRANAELDRQRRDFEQRERQMQDERERMRFQPDVEFADPGQKMMYQMFMEERQERRREREERDQERQRAEKTRQQGEQLYSAYESIMGSVPTHQRIAEDQFFTAGMARIYPSGIPEGMSPQQAVANAARFLGIQSNGYAPPQPQPNLRDRRASIMIPSAPSYQGGQSGGPVNDGIGQRDGETPEQYRDRLERLVREQGINTMNLPEGRKFSSG